jgi:hypothetical protein
VGQLARSLWTCFGAIVLCLVLIPSNTILTTGSPLANGPHMVSPSTTLPPPQSIPGHVPQSSFTATWHAVPGQTAGSIASAFHHYLQAKYRVTFIETGFPPGPNWAIVIEINYTSLEFSTVAAPTAITFDLPNGSYGFRVLNVTGYFGTPEAGAFSVMGGAMNVSIAFAPGTQSLFPITFFESGLPSNTTWGIDMNGTAGNTTIEGPYGGLLVFLIRNGTNPFIAEPTEGFVPRGGLLSAEGSGTITMSGAAIEIPLAYVHAYHIDFVERGLGAGITWSVQLNGTIKSSSSSNISFEEPNGSYWFLVPYSNLADYVSTPYSGALSVTGIIQTVEVQFTFVTYSVQFIQYDLPQGTMWWVNISAGPSGSSTDEILSLPVANGTYNYSVATADKTFAPQFPTGQLRVEGPPEFEFLEMFSRVTFTVRFNETGLAKGTAWAVTFNNTFESGLGLIEFPGSSNGTYAFTVRPPSGYSSDPSTGTVTVEGSNQVKTIAFAPIPRPSTPTTILGLPTTEAYALGGGIIAAIAVAGVMAVVWKRRSESPTNPRLRTPPHSP